MTAEERALEAYPPLDGAAGGVHVIYREKFKEGYHQAEEDLTKDAIETEASYVLSVPCICIHLPTGVKVGDKVKIIVIKEDEV